MSKAVGKRLGDIVNFKRGYDLPSHMREEGSYPIISSGGITGYHSEYKVSGEGVITGRYGTLGEVYYINGNYWPHNTTLYATTFKNNFPKYVYYLLKCLGNLKTADKSAVPGINRNDLHEVIVPYLPPNRQQNISSVLSAIDDKIEINNRINVELEQIAKTLYDYWFVQFDFPDAQGQPYKASGGKMVYNEVLKREISEGWNVKTIGDYCKSIGGFAFKSSWWTDEGFPVVKIKDIQENYTINLSELAFVDISDKKIDDKFKAKPGDVLIAMTGATVGKYGIVPYTEKPLYVNQRVGYFNLGKNPLKKLPFLINSLNQKYFREAVFTLASGAAQPNISNEQINNIHLLLPTNEIIEKYNSILEPYYSRILINHQQNQQLSALRDWLLPMLMNGQVEADRTSMSTKESASMALQSQARHEKAAQLNIPANKKSFAKQVLAGKIVSKFIDDRSLTEIKFQKIQFLAEHIIEADLNLNYYCQAAGPYDNKFMHTIYNDFHKQKWFDFKNKRFIPLEKHEKIEGYYQGYFDSVQVQLNKLFDLLYNASEAEAEIIATIYAVWNNRVIRGQAVSDEELIKDFYLWSERKKQYTKRQVSIGLQWLKKHHMEPKGFGKLIKNAKPKS